MGPNRCLRCCGGFALGGMQRHLPCRIHLQRRLRGSYGCAMCPWAILLGWLYSLHRVSRGHVWRHHRSALRSLQWSLRRDPWMVVPRGPDGSHGDCLLPGPVSRWSRYVGAVHPLSLGALRSHVQPTNGGVLWAVFASPWSAALRGWRHRQSGCALPRQYLQCGWGTTVRTLRCRLLQ